MDNEVPQVIDEPELPPKREFENAADAAGLWFAAAVVFAVLAAGIIVYRSSNSDIVTAANDPAPPAAHFDRLSPAIVPQR